MDAYGERELAAMGEAAANVSENEAESMQVQEEKRAAAALNNLNSCPVCSLNFYSREPKLLPCLHSFCANCLPAPSRNLALAAAPNSHVDGVKPLNVIRCPVCRQECMEVDVMENVFVEGSVEASSSTAERAAQICMTCDDNTEAEGFCVNCVEYLCPTCVEAHQRVKFTKDHTITKKEEVSKEIHGWSTQRPMFCDTHKQEPLKLFCETCDRLTCRDCQLLGHKDHSYHFLEDAYKHHKEHVETMSHQLQDKRKLIEEVSNTINNRLLQAERNRSTVQTEIKNSVCSLIAELNKKGQMLLNQLESVTKDHESVLLKQQEDIGYLSRHLDHVISFTEWATARNRGTAFLHCKRLILFQMGNLLQAKCSTSFVPQSIVRFQGQSSYWASSVDLGSLVVECAPGNQLPGFQGIPYHARSPRLGPSGSPHSFAIGTPRNTLAQLQMQVEKLNPPVRWQAQPPWTWCQSVRLQRSGPDTLHRHAPSHNAAAHPRSGFVAPPQSPSIPASSLSNPGFTPQHPRFLGSSTSYQSKPGEAFSSPLFLSPVTVANADSQSIHTGESPYLNKRTNPGHPLKRDHPQPLVSFGPHRNVHGQQSSEGHGDVSEEEEGISGCFSWKPAETAQTNGDDGPSVRKRRKPSPGPIIIIKDDPDDDITHSQVYKRTSLPDSTGDQAVLQTQVSNQEEDDASPRQGAGDKFQSPVHLHSTQGEEHSHSSGADHGPSFGGGEWREALSDQSDRGLCAVCRTGGELLSCNECSRQFHLPCHIPALQNFPSARWLCSFCLDFTETGSERGREAGRVTTESDSKRGFLVEDKRKCDRLLLHLLCSDLSPGFGESPMACANDRKKNGPAKLQAVRERLEATHHLCYQNLAEFVVDVRLACRNCAVKPEPGVTLATKELNEQFEEHLRKLFPDQTFPEMKPSSCPDSVSCSVPVLNFPKAD